MPDNSMAAGRLDPRPLVGRVEPLAGWQSCFDGMASGEIVKGVLNRHPNRAGEEDSAEGIPTGFGQGS